MSARHTPSTARIQRRLEKWELDHLRALAVEQAERIERLEQALATAEDSADFWNRSFLNLEEHLDDGSFLALTERGTLIVMPTEVTQ